MIIDEVKTGFRAARSGGAGATGVKADLCTLPRPLPTAIDSVAGRADIMDPGNRRFCGITYTRHSVALAAAEKCLEILDETPALETLANYGSRWRDGIGRILARRGIPHSFVGHPSMSGLFFSEKAPTNYRDWASTDYTLYDALAPRLHDLGILCEPDSREPWFVCEAHDDECLALTLERFERGLDETLSELSREQSRLIS